MSSCKGNYLAQEHDPGCWHGEPSIPDLDEPGDSFNMRKLHILRLRKQLAQFRKEAINAIVSIQKIAKEEITIMGEEMSLRMQEAMTTLSQEMTDDLLLPLAAERDALLAEVERLKGES